MGQKAPVRPEVPNLDGGRWIWVLAVLFFGIGDLLTTSVGIGLYGVREAGPVTAVLVRQYGLGAIPLLKTVVLCGGFVCWKVIPRPQRVGVPLGLTIVGVSVTSWNLHVLALALSS